MSVYESLVGVDALKLTHVVNTMFSEIDKVEEEADEALELERDAQYPGINAVFLTLDDRMIARGMSREDTDTFMAGVGFILSALTRYAEAERISDSHTTSGDEDFPKLDA